MSVKNQVNGLVPQVVRTVYSVVLRGIIVAFSRTIRAICRTHVANIKLHVHILVLFSCENRAEASLEMDARAEAGIAQDS